MHFLSDLFKTKTKFNGELEVTTCSILISKSYMQTTEFERS